MKKCYALPTIFTIHATLHKIVAGKGFSVTPYYLKNFYDLFFFSISLDILFSTAQLFPALFLVQSFAILHQSSFPTFARFLWIVVSLHIVERPALQLAT